jgi:hypothetical protein
MLFVFIICLFVCNAMSRSKATRNLKPNFGETPEKLDIARKQQVVSLITFFDLIIYMSSLMLELCRLT